VTIEPPSGQPGGGFFHASGGILLVSMANRPENDRFVAALQHMRCIPGLFIDPV